MTSAAGGLGQRNAPLPSRGGSKPSVSLPYAGSMTRFSTRAQNAAQPGTQHTGARASPAIASAPPPSPAVLRFEPCGCLGFLACEDELVELGAPDSDGTVRQLHASRSPADGTPSVEGRPRDLQLLRHLNDRQELLFGHARTVPFHWPSGVPLRLSILRPSSAVTPPGGSVTQSRMPRRDVRLTDLGESILGFLVLVLAFGLVGVPSA